MGRSLNSPPPELLAFNVDQELQPVNGSNGLLWILLGSMLNQLGLRLLLTHTPECVTFVAAMVDRGDLAL